MASMKISAPGMFASVIADLRRGKKSMADYYEFGLDEMLTHLRETVAGKHTLAEFAEHYCIEKDPDAPPHCPCRCVATFSDPENCKTAEARIVDAELAALPKAPATAGIEITAERVEAALNLDMHAAGETELARVSTPEMIAKIRAKQAAKPKFSPLPIAAPPTYAGFRAGAEWAAGMAEQLYRRSGPAIRAALAALPFDRITALYDAESSEVGDDISVSLAVDLVAARDEIRRLKTALAALPEGGDGWREIGTVPHDQDVLVTDGAGVWQDIFMDDNDGNAVWDIRHPSAPQPTYWQPLPLPPAISPGGGT